MCVIKWRHGFLFTLEIHSTPTISKTQQKPFWETCKDQGVLSDTQFALIELQL